MPVLGNLGVALGHPSLDLDRAADSIDNTGKLDQHVGDRGLDDAPLVVGDFGIDQCLAMGFASGKRHLLVLSHKTALATWDIGGQNGG